MRQGSRPGQHLEHHAPRQPPESAARFGFEVDFEAAPDKFFRGDIRERAGRRLIFTSDEQLEIAARHHTSHGDGAFRHVYAHRAFVSGARGSVRQVNH